MVPAAPSLPYYNDVIFGLLLDLRLVKARICTLAGAAGCTPPSTAKTGHGPD